MVQLLLLGIKLVAETPTAMFHATAHPRSEEGPGFSVAGRCATLAVYVRVRELFPLTSGIVRSCPMSGWLVRSLVEAVEPTDDVGAAWLCLLARRLSGSVGVSSWWSVRRASASSLTRVPWSLSGPRLARGGDLRLGSLSVASAATYLGFVMGLEGGSHSWAAPVAKWSGRTARIGASGIAVGVVALLCSTTAILVLGYVAQVITLRGCPRVCHRLSCKDRHHITTVPAATTDVARLRAVVEVSGSLADIDLIWLPNEPVHTAWPSLA